jgi:hypothetical protein
LRVTAVLSLMLIACAPTADPSVPIVPVVDRIEVALRNDPPAAEQIKSAFVNEGLQIANVESGLITSVPVTYAPGATFPSEYTYRAVILSDGSGQRVVLSATLRTLKQGDYSATAPLSSICKRYPTHECNQAWSRIERLAEALRAK